MELLIHRRSTRYEGAYVGSLLDSARAEDVEIDDRPDWYVEGRAVRLAEHFDPRVGGETGGHPAEVLTLAMTENDKWLVPGFAIPPGRLPPPILVSTSRDAVLHSVPIELELFCKRCDQSADFQANLEFGMSFLARSDYVQSIGQRLRRKAETTSTLGKCLPVNLAYRGADLVGALRVDSDGEHLAFGTLYVVSDRKTSFTPEHLSGVDLIRRVEYRSGDHSELKRLERPVGRIR